MVIRRGWEKYLKEKTISWGSGTSWIARNSLKWDGLPSCNLSDFKVKNEPDHGLRETSCFALDSESVPHLD